MQPSVGAIVTPRVGGVGSRNATAPFQLEKTFKRVPPWHKALLRNCMRSMKRKRDMKRRWRSLRHKRDMQRSKHQQNTYQATSPVRCTIVHFNSIRPRAFPTYAVQRRTCWMPTSTRISCQRPLHISDSILPASRGSSCSGQQQPHQRTMHHRANAFRTFSAKTIWELYVWNPHSQWCLDSRQFWKKIMRQKTCLSVCVETYI